MAIMKGCEGYEGSKQPFTMVKHCILVGYIVLMKGEGLTNEFIDIDNYYGYTVVLCKDTFPLISYRK